MRSVVTISEDFDTVHMVPQSMPKIDFGSFLIKIYKKMFAV